MALPYARSKTNPSQAQGRIEKTLDKFGVSQTNFGRDYENYIIRVSFVLEGIPVTIPINYMELAQRFLASSMRPFRDQPWKKPLTDQQEKQLKVAINASFAVLEDYLKAMLSLHQLGIMTPAEIFFSNIDVGGVRMIDHLKEKAPQLMRGEQLLLPEVSQ